MTEVDPTRRLRRDRPAAGLPRRLTWSALLLALLGTVYLLVRDRAETDPVTEKYGAATMRLVYPEMDAAEVETMLQETWSRPFVYEPFTQFKEPPHLGEFVNVNAHGFRHVAGQGPWPPDPDNINIFFFGGSTGFGYGVADGQTIASQLQTRLTATLDPGIRVYNFSRGHYYSTQERILYETLLVAGYVPRLAIFLDGLNDFFYHVDEPRYTRHLREYFARRNTSRTERAWARLQAGLERLLHRDAASTASSAGDSYSDPALLNGVISRYLANRKLIEAVSQAYGVQPLFVWQPVPTYGLERERHPFAPRDYGQHSFSGYGYERMAQYLAAHPQGDNFLWTADLHEGFTGPTYVDIVHYSAGFSRRIAEAIADGLVRAYPSFAER